MVNKRIEKKLVDAKRHGPCFRTAMCALANEILAGESDGHDRLEPERGSADQLAGVARGGMDVVIEGKKCDGLRDLFKQIGTGAIPAVDLWKLSQNARNHTEALDAAFIAGIMLAIWQFETFDLNTELHSMADYGRSQLKKIEAVRKVGSQKTTEKNVKIAAEFLRRRQQTPTALKSHILDAMSSVMVKNKKGKDVHLWGSRSKLDRMFSEKPKPKNSD